MIINGEQLRQLAIEHQIVDDVDHSFDGNSLELTMSDKIKRIVVPENHTLRYGAIIPDDYVKETKLDGSITLNAGDCVLSASREFVKMPMGYFGFIQTKGSLARHFVSVACFDGQVDPGFQGPITFELISHSNVPLLIPVGAQVARLFLVKCSSKLGPSYKGRYGNAFGPTEPRIR